MSAITKHRDAAYWVHSNPEDNQPPITVAALQAMNKTACPGPCNIPWRGTRKRPGAYPAALTELQLAETTSHEPDPYAPDQELIDNAATSHVKGEPVWCRDCQTRIRSDLGRLPILAAACGSRRDGHLAPAPPSPSDRHGTRVAPPSQSPGWDQVAVIVEWAASWADTIARAVNTSDPALYLTTGVPARTLARSVRYLQQHLTPALSDDGYAADFGLEVAALVRRSEELAGVDALVHRLPSECLQCGRKALQRKDGHDTIECRACRSTWDQDDYDRLAHAHKIAVAAGSYVKHTSQTPSPATGSGQS